MAIIKRKLRSQRPKALLGADGALMAAAIALQTANDTANTILNVQQAKQNARTTTQNARLQADAIDRQAQAQTRAMAQQNENNNALQQKIIEANKENFEDQTNVLRDMNLNMAMEQGRQNTETRREAAKLIVKHGGSVRRKLRSAKSSPVEGNNMPFIVTDGGGVIPIATTPEGYDLYEIVGNDHEHYHKTRGGKYKSGVGFKFANGGTVEGEGNQRSSTGELVLVTPDDALFISKHSIKGFNPTNAVMRGMHPVKAFNVQESLKNGNNSNKVFIAAYGGNIYDQQPGITTDTVQQRTKLLGMPNNEDIVNGGYNILNGQFNSTDLSRTNVMKARRGCSIKRTKAIDGKGIKQLGWTSLGANTLGAIGGTVANILGNKWITSANNEAADILGQAYDTAGSQMAAAWRNRKGIDESIISDDDYRYDPAVAVIRTARVNKNAELEGLNRQERNELNLATRGTLSSAKRNILRDKIADKYNALRSNIYQQLANESEQIKQSNAQMLNQMSAQNAELAQRSRQARSEARLNLARYNNDIVNENIMGAADAETSALLNKTGVQASTLQANANSRASMASNIANTWNNALQSSIGTMTNLYGAALGADSDVLDKFNFRLFGRTKSKNGGSARRFNLKQINVY
ncbi:MAG: hypothetical protein J6Y28_09775 [Acholeplasmatales bacterium]|nr:hypothetical protein [Methanobrevibacter sp.]MBP5446447.1 hypothetical protein [Acholeplasmatales bacterium]